MHAYSPVKITAPLFCARAAPLVEISRSAAPGESRRSIVRLLVERVMHHAAHKRSHTGCINDSLADNEHAQQGSSHLENLLER